MATDPDAVVMLHNGALIHHDKMIARVVYGTDDLREALRAAAETHVNGGPRCDCGRQLSQPLCNVCDNDD